MESLTNSRVDMLLVNACMTIVCLIAVVRGAKMHSIAGVVANLALHVCGMVSTANVAVLGVAVLYPKFVSEHNGDFVMAAQWWLGISSVIMAGAYLARHFWREPPPVDTSAKAS